MKRSHLLIGLLMGISIVAGVFRVTGFGHAGDERSDALGRLIPKLKPLHEAPSQTWAK